jgi:transposase
MLIAPAGVKIHLALGRTDMRKGFDSLAVLVQEVLKKDPFICVGRGYVAAWSRSA